MRDGDGMGSLIDVVPSEKGDLLSPQSPIVQHQDQRLVTKGHASKNVHEEISKLAFAGNPGCRRGISDEPSFFATYPLGNWVEQVLSVVDANTPIEEDPDRTGTTANGIEGKFRASDVGNLVSGRLVPRSSVRWPAP